MREKIPGYPNAYGRRDGNTRRFNVAIQTFRLVGPRLIGCGSRVPNTHWKTKPRKREWGKLLRFVGDKDLGQAKRRKNLFPQNANSSIRGGFTNTLHPSILVKRISNDEDIRSPILVYRIGVYIINI